MVDGSCQTDENPQRAANFMSFHDEIRNFARNNMKGREGGRQREGEEERRERGVEEEVNREGRSGRVGEQKRVSTEERKSKR